MKETCPSELVEKYFDQEVTDEERSLVESHLKVCPDCQSALDKMEAIRVLIKAPVEEAGQAENFERLWRKIEREIEAQPKPYWKESIRRWFGVGPIFRRKWWAPAVAAAIILMVVVAPLLFKKTSSPSNTSVVEYVESESYNVMVYDLDKGNTVIWLLDRPETEGSSKS